MTQNDNQDDTTNGWQSWFDLWRDGIAAGTGSWQVSPWSALTEAIWCAIQEHSDDDPRALTQTLRQSCRDWHRLLQDGLPSARWFTDAVVTLTRLPIPYATATDDTAGVFSHLAGQMPHLGPLQHHQARLERLAHAVEGYQHALAAYIDELTALADNSVDSLENALCDDQTDIDRSNPRAVYDLWCHLAEREYEQQMATDHYAQALSRLTNSWSELQLAFQPVADDALDTFGLPTRRGLDETQAALDRLRRRHKAETRELRERLAALEAQLNPSTVQGESPGSQADAYYASG